MKRLLFLSLSLFFFSQCKNENGNIRPEAPKQTSIIGDEYSERSYMLHYVLLILEKDGDHKKRKADLMAFNEENGFSEKRMNNIYVPIDGKENRPIVSIRRFQNLPEAKEYIEVLTEKGFLKNGEKALPFSQDNYRRFLKNKNLAEYEAFCCSIK